MPDGSTDLLSTVRPNTMARYSWNLPIGAFAWPMDAMMRQPGQETMSYDDLLAYLRGTGRYWWLACVYEAHTGLLDMYIMFEDGSRVYRYILDYD